MRISRQAETSSATAGKNRAARLFLNMCAEIMRSTMPKYIRRDSFRKQSHFKHKSATKAASGFCQFAKTRTVDSVKERGIHAYNMHRGRHKRRALATDRSSHCCSSRASGIANSQIARSMCNKSRVI